MAPAPGAHRAGRAAHARSVSSPPCSAFCSLLLLCGGLPGCPLGCLCPDSRLARTQPLVEGQVHSVGSSALSEALLFRSYLWLSPLRLTGREVCEGRVPTWLILCSQDRHQHPVFLGDQCSCRSLRFRVAACSDVRRGAHCQTVLRCREAGLPRREQSACSGLGLLLPTLCSCPCSAPWGPTELCVCSVSWCQGLRSRASSPRERSLP